MDSLYNIVNNTGGTVFIEDADGHLIPVGPSGVQIALTIAGYQQAIKLFGSTNVVLVVTTTASNSPYIFTSLGDSSISVTSGSAIPLSPPAQATIVQIQVAGGNVRYRDDGVAPTPSIGIEILAGGMTQLALKNLENISFIAESTDANLTICYFK